MKKSIILLTFVLTSLQCFSQSYNTTVEVDKISSIKNGIITSKRLYNSDLAIKISKQTSEGPSLDIRLSKYPFPNGDFPTMFLFNKKNNSVFRNSYKLNPKYNDTFQISTDNDQTLFVFANNGDKSKLVIRKEGKEDKYIINITNKQYWDIKVFIVENCRPYITFME